MKAHWTDATVGENGQLILDNLPFKPGQAVEVFVLSRALTAGSKHDGTLRDSVIEYREPFEPVASDDWEALR